MSANIPTHYVSQFSTNLQLLLQQKGSKLRGTVTEGKYSGKAASPVDQVAAVAAQRVTGRFQAMPRVDALLDRRWVYPVDYDLPQLIDTFDKLRLIMDPQSTFATNAMLAMGRAMDDEIIANYFADAKTGETGGTTTAFGTTLTTAGTPGQNVSVSTGGTASGFNVAKLREAKLALGQAEVDFDMDQIITVCKERQHDNLLNEVQIISSDFNGGDRPVLKEGRIERFLGIDIKTCERLQTGTDDAAGTSTMVPVYAKSGMHLGVWNDIENSIGQREDIRGKPYQLYSIGTFGATRTEEKKMVRVWCR
ncbi:MAG: hypothetical protein KA144_02180 [Xanthomonadaceae bacterium]|nr:hypothetical protein [Xanthomonadaceae bacterium]MBP7622449.1 hypothetical protein [Xanthomonadales bacterium]